MAGPNRVSGTNLLAAFIALIVGGALLFWFALRPLFV